MQVYITVGSKAVQISQLRTKTQTLRIIQEMRSKRTEKEKSAMKTKYGVTMSTNPLLGLPFDLHRLAITRVCSV